MPVKIRCCDDCGHTFRSEGSRCPRCKSTNTTGIYPPAARPAPSILLSLMYHA